MLSEAFYISNFTYSIIASVIGIIIGSFIVLIFAMKQHCRTPTTLFTCNTAAAHVLYLIDNLIVCFYGFNENWASNQPICKFRAYSFLALGTAACYSNAFQAAGRLFITVLHKHKFLATYRVTCSMIILNWILAILLPIIPFFSADAYVFERESRLCTISSRNFLMSFFAATANLGSPLFVSIIVYIKILRHAKASRAVVPFNAPTVHTSGPNMKRESRVARTMVIILTIFASTGVPFLIVMLWNILSPQNPPPEVFYLLSVNTIPFVACLTMYVLLKSSKEIKAVALKYLGLNRRHRRIHGVTTTQPRPFHDVKY